MLLFRYSALTFNGHRIHYDRAYVTDGEGYPGLVVHGPLIATLLIDLIRRNAPDARIARILIPGHVAAVRRRCDERQRHAAGCDGVVRLWAANAEGGLAMSAEAKLA